jgi:hypothetical protein
MNRRFSAGATYRIPPMDYRLVSGRKGAGDLRLDWRWHDDDGRISPWRPVELDHVALILDAIADNENYLYPPPAAGGAYVTKFVRTVFREGWAKARTELHLQRMQKDMRRCGALLRERQDGMT